VNNRCASNPSAVSQAPSKNVRRVFERHKPASD
jgi:hypothetical protein